MSKIVAKVLDNYPGNNSTTEQAWDFIQRNVSSAGNTDPRSDSAHLFGPKWKLLLFDTRTKPSVKRHKLIDGAEKTATLAQKFESDFQKVL